MVNSTIKLSNTRCIRRGFDNFNILYETIRNVLVEHNLLCYKIHQNVILNHESDAIANSFNSIL